MVHASDKLSSDHGAGAKLTERIWQVLSDVRDPELQVVSVVELGMISAVMIDDMGSVNIDLKPSYLGCPALRYIEESIVKALNSAGVQAAAVRRVLSPGWSPSDISEVGARKLAEEGIHISHHSSTSGLSGHGARSLARRCPACGSDNLIITSSFGASPCLQMARCNLCGEPQAVFRCR